MQDGCRWSVIYALSSVTLLLIALNAVLMTLGAWNYFARAISGCLCCLLSMVNLAAIIVTATFRFNTVGKLAALSLTPSKFSGEPFSIS